MQYEYMKDHDLFREVARAIATHVGGRSAGPKAATILARDKGGHQLVGLLEYGEMVGYFEPLMYNLVSYPYHRNALDGKASYAVAQPTNKTDVQDWLSTREDVVWTHPRFRQ